MLRGNFLVKLVAPLSAADITFMCVKLENGKGVDKNEV